MRAVADEDHTVVDEALQAPALEGIDRHPVELEIGAAEHALDARPDVFRLPLDLGIGIPAELQVDAVNVVGLLVQQRRLAGVEGRLEPEAALRREVGLELDVGDEEPLLEELTSELQPSSARTNDLAPSQASR